jgi:anti-anti-sigma factor
MQQPSVIELQGRIDHLTSPAIETRISSALDAAPTALVLDFTAVTFVSSIGLRMMLMAAKRCRKQNAKIALHSVPPQIVELLRMSALTAFFSIHADRESALAAIA